MGVLASTGSRGAPAGVGGQRARARVLLVASNFWEPCSHCAAGARTAARPAMNTASSWPGDTSRPGTLSASQVAATPAASAMKGVNNATMRLGGMAVGARRPPPRYMHILGRWPGCRPSTSGARSSSRVRRGRPMMSAIGKAPVDGRVRVAGVNVEGDDQADRACTAGPTRRSTRTPPRTRVVGGSSGASSARARSARTSRPRASTSAARSSASAGGSATRGSRSPSRGSRAPSSGCGWASRRWSSASRRPRGRARTCGSSARASSAPATRSRWSRGPSTA